MFDQFSKRSIALLSGVAFFSAGCMQIGSVGNGSALTSSGPVTETFQGHDKVDLLFTVNSSQLSADQQQQINRTISSVLAGLQNSNIDYHAGAVNASGGQSTVDISQLGSSSSPNSWVNLALGTLIPLSQGQSFLNSQSSSALEGQLINAVVSATASSGGSQNKNNYQQLITTLAPVILQAAQGGSQGQSADQIMAAISPMLMQAASSGNGGGNYQQLLQLALPLVQHAAAGGQNQNSYNELVSALVPIGIAVAMNGSGGGQYAQIASVALPVVTSLMQKGGQGASFQDLMASVLPIVMTQLTKSGSNSQYGALIAVVTPLVLKMISGNNGQPMTANDILNSLLPIAMSSIGSGSGSGNSQYTAMLSAAMPSVLQLIQNKNLSQDPNALTATLTDIGLTAAMSALQSKSGNSSSFLRPDAILQIIAVGQGQNGQVDPQKIAAAVLQQLAQSKGNDPSLVKFSNLLASGGSTCDMVQAAASLYPQIAQYSGGSVSDLCKDPSSAQSVMTQAVLASLTNFALKNSANPQSLQVKVDGAVVPMGDVNGWTLSPDGKTVEFHGSYVPVSGSKIEIQYVPKA